MTCPTPETEARASGTIPRVGVFDSGVGGLTIYETIRQRLPGLGLDYCMDNAHFPYGPRQEADLVQCVLGAAGAFVARAGLAALVVACNTASTVVLPDLRRRLTIPVVGVVPAIKPAAARSQSKVIALLATPGTIARAYTDALFREHAPECRVIRLGSRRLVELAEAKLRGHLRPAELAEQVRREIEPLFIGGAGPEGGRLDTVVLGCTHFPLLIPELEAAAPWPVAWLDSGAAVAARVERVLAELGVPGAAPRIPADRGDGTIYQTGPDADWALLAPALARLGLTRREAL